MRGCLTTDELVTVNNALQGNVAAVLQHLQICGTCREQIEDMDVIRIALAETATVNDEILGRCAAVAGGDTAHEDFATPAATRIVANAAEALLAGLTAPVVVISSGMQMGATAAGALAVACGLAVLAFRTIHRQPVTVG